MLLPLLLMFPGLGQAGAGCDGAMESVFSSPPTASASLSLSVQGSCPGPITLRVQNASPGATIALAVARNTGTFVLPPQFACGGTVLGLGATPRLIRVVIANGNGSASIVDDLPPHACGRYVQVIDLGSCNTSNVLQL